MVQKICPAESVVPIVNMTEIVSQMQVQRPFQCQKNLQQQTLVAMDNLNDTVGHPNYGQTGPEHDIFPETPDTES